MERKAGCDMKKSRFKIYYNAKYYARLEQGIKKMVSTRT